MIAMLNNCFVVIYTSTGLIFLSAEVRYYSGEVMLSFGVVF